MNEKREETLDVTQKRFLGLLSTESTLCHLVKVRVIVPTTILLKEVHEDVFSSKRSLRGSLLV